MRPYYGTSYYGTSYYGNLDALQPALLLVVRLQPILEQGRKLVEVISVRARLRIGAVQPPRANVCLLQSPKDVLEMAVLADGLCGHQWQSVAIGGNQRHSVVTCGNHQW